MEKRKVSLEGLSGYDCYEDGSIVRKEDGKVIEPNKEGNVKLIGDDGEKVTYSAGDILASVEEYFEGLEDEGEDLDAEYKRLVAARKAANDGLLPANGCTKVNLLERFEAVDVATDAVEAFVKRTGYKAGKQKAAKKEKAETTPPSEELIAAQTKHDDAKATLDAAKAEYETALAELRVLKPKMTGDHTPKRSYRDAQEIRKAIKEGTSIADLCKQWNCSSSAINYYKNYLQFPLRTKPAVEAVSEDDELLYTAWTPLVNPYYPAAWKGDDGKIYCGAPLEGQGNKPSDIKYHYLTTEDLS